MSLEVYFLYIQWNSLNQAFVVSGFCSMHFTLTLDRLKNIVRYTGDFVIPGTSLYRGLRYIGDFVIPGTSLYRGLRYTGDFVISGFHCTLKLLNDDLA